MNGFNQFIENRLMPVAAKMSSNKALVAIRDGITLSMPLLIIGSIFMIIASFPFPGWESWLGEIGVAGYLWKGVDGSFSLLGLVSAFGIAYSYSKQEKVDGVASGLISLASFITVTPYVNSSIVALANPDVTLPKGFAVPSGIMASYMSAKGVFVAILLGLISAIVYDWFINHNIQITLPDSVPPAVARSFSAIIPGAIIITFWLMLYGILDANNLPNLHELAQTILGKPLGLLGSNVIGVSILAGLNSLFWFVGIHGGNTVNAIMKPTWIDNLSSNVSAYQAGEPLKEIFTTPFMDNFVYIGGGGATIGLVLCIAWYAKRKNGSKQSKVLAPLTVIPGFFNINEPTMFGLPVVMNVSLLIPFILAPMVNTIVAWLAMSSGLVPLTRAEASWTMPPILSGFLTTGSVMGSLLQIVLIIIDIALYLPFFMAMEKEFKKQEKSEE
ncbi:UNVERIFIED_CONTAM: PTS sugar transporter subunit IIC [Streptococcus canis]|uniref:Permease IIC component n=1 Tax=Streptococcus canis FSL Z3-227 TaxID=482234 RepID=A0AAV3FT11_STRCB|nr:PTS sugar transporter subunit IIC [Streptococcus canis]EIQ82195.1 sugar phosphotransferase system (PTS), IIC component [Streptococcus canis FSL Z3-227]MDV5988556.1 PTS sugar transporter subunit IIC [Streptococcus canis]MDV5993990.1 PTS sugar transporter subunit IIC [Streptococcus canis]MDV6001562.1 PTS sugar transporter subunit IIC [Streptococcus canis]VEE25158.1 PTS system, cellobiose-specific IIC component [Streptococcus canis]